MWALPGRGGPGGVKEDQRRRAQTNKSSRAKPSGGAMRSWSRLRSEKESWGADGRAGGGEKSRDFLFNKMGFVSKSKQIFRLSCYWCFIFQREVCSLKTPSPKWSFYYYFCPPIMERCSSALSTEKKKPQCKAGVKIKANLVYLKVFFSVLSFLN